MSESTQISHKIFLDARIIDEDEQITSNYMGLYSDIESENLQMRIQSILKYERYFINSVARASNDKGMKYRVYCRGIFIMQQIFDKLFVSFDHNKIINLKPSLISYIKAHNPIQYDLYIDIYKQSVRSNIYQALLDIRIPFIFFYNQFSSIVYISYSEYESFHSIEDKLSTLNAQADIREESEETISESQNETIDNTQQEDIINNLHESIIHNEDKTSEIHNEDKKSEDINLSNHIDYQRSHQENLEEYSNKSKRQKIIHSARFYRRIVYILFLSFLIVFGYGILIGFRISLAYFFISYIEYLWQDRLIKSYNSKKDCNVSDSQRISSYNKSVRKPAKL